MLRKIILSVIGILLVVGATLWSNKLADSKKKPRPKPSKRITAVFTETVKNGTTPISITTSGNLMAKRRIELFSEVQGIFESTGRDFLPGEHYKSGSVLIKINSDEHRSNIRSQKSNLYNQIVNFIPDLRLDYPEAYPKWETFVHDFDVNKPLPKLPEATTEKEKLFIAGRNISTTYFNIQNLEERLVKYSIHAPFYGILTEANVRHGALIRAGQKLGEFISPAVYELEVAVNESYSDLLKNGKLVTLRNSEKTKSWQGKVSRVNGTVNPNSQTIQVFIQVIGNDLKEGMYLEAEVNAKEEENTFEIDRKLLVEDSKMFVVRDSLLEILEVNPVYFKENSVVIKGLLDGTEILAKAVPGAYPGMKVKVFKNN